MTLINIFFILMEEFLHSQCVSIKIFRKYKRIHRILKQI